MSRKNHVQHTVKKFKKSNSVEDSILDKPRSGRPRSKRSPQIIRSVRAKIEGNPNKPIRKMAREAGMAAVVVWRIIIWSTNLTNWEEELILLIKPWKRGCCVGGQSFVFSNRDDLQASFGLMRRFHSWTSPLSPEQQGTIKGYQQHSNEVEITPENPKTSLGNGVGSSFTLRPQISFGFHTQGG